MREGSKYAPEIWFVIFFVTYVLFSGEPSLLELIRQWLASQIAH